MGALDILAQINAIAETAALEVASEVVRENDRIANFRPRSDATQASPGWKLPVAPEGIDLYGYQKAAVETILEHHNVVLGLEPGMGKTIVALSAVAALAAKGHRTLVIVPPSLRVDPWQRDAAKRFPHLRVAIVEGTKSAPLPDVDVVIMGDSVTSSREEDILAWRPTGLVVDEAHRCKSRTSARSKAALEISEYVRGRDGYVILLTGTLSVNDPAEIFQPLRIAGATRALSGSDYYSDFLRRWCITETVWTGAKEVLKCVGAADPEGMHERLREIAYVRVAREDVLDMPDKVWVHRSLHLNGDLATYRRMESDFIAWVNGERGAEAGRRAAKAEAVTKLMALWQEAGKAKVKAAAEYVTNLVEQGEQVVVMGWHAAVIGGLRDVLESTTVHGRKVTTVSVVGGMTADDKATAQDTFRAGTADVLLGNITAAGVGLNLDNAAHLVFVQLPWSAGDLIQASDRIYRVTQRRACTIHVLGALGTVDERLSAVLDRKVDITNQINAGDFSGQSDFSGSVADGVLSSYGYDY